MVQMTMKVSEELAKQWQPIRSWLPTILQISFVGFKTLATQTASEVIAFLSSNPTPQEVLNYHISEHSQTRLQQLLTLHKAGLLGGNEQLELDELEELEHIFVMLKAQVAQQLQKKH